MTYSIVARDPQTGQMGVAVQSHYFSVGSLCPWAEAGVGAVATQSMVDPAYGPLGLGLMRAGKTAQGALASLVAGDPGQAVRQVAMVDVNGQTAAHTGDKCIQMAGHTSLSSGGSQLLAQPSHIDRPLLPPRTPPGTSFSVQANMMLKDTVWDAMAAGYASGDGDLADRMLAALFAAEAQGGDIRGRQSAAMIVVTAESTGRPWVDTVLDLRVEDHPEPLQELQRLLEMKRAYLRAGAADKALENGDMESALLEFAAAQQAMADNPELKFWHAVALAFGGRVDEAMPLFKDVFESDSNWAELLRRLPAAGLVPEDRQLIELVTSGY